MRVKLNGAQWWRARQPADPWDAGYLPNTPVATLQARRSAFLHPVRLQVVEAAAGPAPGQPAEPERWRGVVAGQVMSQALVVERDVPGGGHPAA